MNKVLKVLKMLSPAALFLLSLGNFSLLEARPMPTFATNRENLQAKEKMIDELDFIQSMVETTYAPAQWKKEQFQWSIEKAVNQAKEQILLSSKMGTKGFHYIVRSLFHSMKDYHVHVLFNATEKASLPLTVKGHKGRYYITSIDRNVLKEKQYPFQIGDEILSFDRKPIADIINELRQNMMQASPLTDQSLAEIALTRRTAVIGDQVPSGNLEIRVRTAGKEKAHNLFWQYAQEVMDDGTWHKSPSQTPKERFSTLLQKSGRFSKESAERLYHFFKHPMLYAPFASNYFKNQSEPNLIGNLESFVPNLGTLVWKASHPKINAYIFRTEEKTLVGYLRVPSYYQLSETGDSFKMSYEELTLNDLAQVIGHLEAHTEALVLDQVNNPGGLLTEAYAVSSLLTDKPLQAAPEHIQLSANLVLELHSLLEYMEMLGGFDEIIAQMVLEPMEVDAQMVEQLKAFCRWVIAEWQKGVKYTSPCYLAGVETIKPHSVHYTKPILMLVNELDFSCGDIVPAILQDNKRAILIGTKTAGAGGAVSSVMYPNSFSIEGFTTTWTLLKRADDRPIENLGVEPDLKLEITEEDLTHNFAHYKREVLAALKTLLSK